MKRGIKHQKVNKCILVKGDIAKYAQRGMKVCGFTCIFVFFLFICNEEVSPCSDHECIH